MAIVDLQFEGFKTAEDIYGLFEQRRRDLGADFQRMRTIRDLMNGEIALPLPELNKQEQAAVANLARESQDQLSRRISSVLPALTFPSVHPGFETADNRAMDRKRVMGGWHHDNKLKRRLGKRARFFLSYAMSPVVIKPDGQTRLPRWDIRSPLDTFPPPSRYDEFIPDDCIFLTIRTYGWLRERYGPIIDRVRKPVGWDFDNPFANWDREFRLLEYIDAQERTLVLLGAEPPTDRRAGHHIYPPGHGERAVILETAPNLTGRSLVVVPGRITLDAQLGHFDGTVGMYQAQAALMALTVIAQRRAVWPREWLVARPGEEPEIINVPDPTKGIPGELQGGDLQTQVLDPSFRTLEVMDRLQEHIRAEGNAIPEFSGLSSSNIRTGRRGSQIMGASIDFTIAETQEIFAESLWEEDKLAIAVDRAYFNQRKVYQISTRSYWGQVRYTPEELWETDAHVVDYPIAGTDLQNLPVEGGQRVAMQTLSREGFMEMDPAVKDHKAEIQRIHREGVQTAFLSSIQALAAEPEGPFQPEHLARLDKALAGGTELYEAVMDLQREIQEEQATPTEDVAETQPGLSPPGQGVEQPGQIPEQPADMDRLTQLLGSLGTTQQAQRFRS